MKKPFLALVAALTVIDVGSVAKAATLTSGGGSFTVGLDASGALYDTSTAIGFRRNSDGLDALKPGTPRDSWGASANSSAGWADPNDTGNSLLSDTLTVTGPGTATVVASTPGLTITQNYSFVAGNVLQVATTVQNTSGVAANVLFQRDVDWDVSPTAFNEITNVPAYGPPVVAASSYGFESPSPLVAFSFPIGPAGGTSNAADNGAGIRLSLGTLLAGQSTSFNFYYGESTAGQSKSSLQSQMTSLGASYLSTVTYSSDTGNTNTAALGVGPALTPLPVSVYGGLLLLGGLAMVSYRRGLVHERSQ
jgi:hypothetical protein